MNSEKLSRDLHSFYRVNIGMGDIDGDLCYPRDIATWSGVRSYV